MPSRNSYSDRLARANAAFIDDRRCKETACCPNGKANVCVLLATEKTASGPITNKIKTPVRVRTGLALTCLNTTCSRFETSICEWHYPGIRQQTKHPQVFCPVRLPENPENSVFATKPLAANNRTEEKLKELG